MTNTTNTISKVAAIAAAVALVGMLAVAPAAHAQTTTTTTSTSASTASLQAEIASLQAQLAASQGTTMVAATFTRDLTIGSTGSDVTALQTWLISKGYSIPAGATGYFGTQTQAAVAAYQTANGISPNAGYFGPITRAKVNQAAAATTTTTTTTTTVGGCAPGAAFSSTTGAACGSSTTTTSGSTALTGGEGSLNNFQTIGATQTILGQGANQNVYGFSFMAGGSDLLVNRINYDVVLGTTNGDATASIHPWNVFNTATLTNAAGQTLATVDASNQNNWSQEGTGNGTFGVNGDQVYQLSFQNLNQVVKEGTSQTYYLMLSTAPVISSANNNAIYQVALEGQGVRSTDALGLQEYSPSSVTSATVEVQTTTAGNAVVSTGSDNPTVTTVMGAQTTPTDNVVLNTFTVQANGENLEMYSLPVSVTTTGASPSAVVQSLSLYEGSTLLDTVSPVATSTAGTEIVNFNNVNLQIPEGTTDSFSVEANISPIDGVTVPNGVSVTVSVPNAMVLVSGGSTSAYPNVEDASGNNVSVTGASTGNAISFASLGVSVGTPTTSATVTNNGGNVTGQTGTFTFNFNVTAFGQAIYIASTTGAFNLTIHDATSGMSTSTSGSAISSGATRSTGGNYVVQNGQTQSFTVTATEATGHGDFFYATLNSLKYGTSDSTATASTTPLPSTFTTSAVAINS